MRSRPTAPKRHPRHAGPVACAAAAVLAACGGGCGAKPSGTAPRGCVADAECAAPTFCHLGTCQGLGVTVASPASDLRTNCAAPIQLVVAAQAEVAADELVLVVNGAAEPVGRYGQPLACHGDGTYRVQGRARLGTHWAESAVRLIDVDRTPPFATWDPPAVEQEQPARTALVAHFSEPIDPATLPPGSVHLGVRGVDSTPTASLSADGLVLTVPLPQPLPELVPVRLTLPSTVADVAGNLLQPAGDTWWRQPATFLALDAPLLPRAPYVSGTIPFTVTAQGPQPTGVRLHINDTVIDLPGPPWTYAWDTTQWPDGTYYVLAEGLGAGGAVSPAASYVIDRTPPQATIAVASSPWTPPDWMSSHSLVSVYFSEPVDATTVDHSTVLITDGAGAALPFALEVDPYGASARAMLKPFPPVLTRVQVAVTAGITNKAGVPLAPAQASFFVPEWIAQENKLPPAGGAVVGDFNYQLFREPGQPDRVTYAGYCLNVDPGLPAAHLTHDMDRWGSYVAVAWSEADASGRWLARVYSTERYAFGSWMVHRPAPDRDAARDGLEPVVALNHAAEDPHPVLAWIETDGVARSLLASRWNGTAWEALGGDIGSGAAHEPSLVIDASGRPVLAWVEATGAGPRQLWVRRWDAGAWGPPEGPFNADPAQPAREPVLTAGGGGLWLAWTEPVAGVDAVQVRRWDGVAWTDAGVVTGGRAPWLGFDPSGAPFLVRLDPASGLIRVARRAGNAWADIAGPVDPAPPLPGTTAQLTWDGYGLEAIWTDAGGRLWRTNYNQ